MKRGLIWPIAMAALLAAVVVSNIWVAVIAADDPSFAIEPDYYRKAVAWDSVMAQADHNAALGWTLTPQLGAFGADSGAALQVSLTNAAGEAIRDAAITVIALHNARAGDARTVALRADGDRGYVAMLPVHRAGQWELRFDVVRGADRFTANRRLEAVPSGAP